MKTNSNLGNILEENLLNTLRAFDNQILRALQREPSKRDSEGVQKWQIYQNKIEDCCSFLLNSVGDRQIDLDGLIILTQALSKTLNLICEDLGAEGLGKLRTDYIKSTFDKISRDAQDANSRLSQEPLLS